MEPSTIFPDLKDKSVFITGGGSGIGAYLTDGFLKQGAKVAFVGQNPETNAAHCDAMEKKHGQRPLFIQCDVRDIPALQAAIAEAAERQGDIQVLVNNAANDTRHTLMDYAPDDWDNTMNINLRPHFFTAQAVAPGMKAMGGGAIVNYSSISYLLANPEYPAYGTAKAAIVGLTRLLANELGPDNIRVNCILPGWVMTERQKRLWVTDEGIEATLKGQALKELIQPEDMIGPCLFLASDAARMMTAQTMIVDAGWV